MIQREYEALIQDVLDGTATPAEVEKLQAWLEVNELGRTRRRELERVFQTLGRVPSAEAPAGLRDAVLSALEAQAPAAESVRGRAAGSRRWFVPRVRLAYVLAAGIAAGAVGVGALTGVMGPIGPGGEPSVTGTMMPSGPPASGAVRRAWKAGETRIEAVAWRAGMARMVAVHIRGGEPAEVELRFDPGELSPGAVRQSGAAGTVQVEAGRVTVRGGNRTGYTFEFQGAQAAPIQVTLRAGGVTTSGELPTP